MIAFRVRQRRRREQLGRYEEMIGDLTTLVQEYPLRERLWVHLIDALGRSGRRVEALEACNSCIRTSSPTSPTPRAPIRRGAGVNQLSTGTGTTAPVVVVSGAPGVGKTTFAVHVAHQVREEYPDGQLYVNLQGHAPDEPLAPTLALERFIRALGVPASEVPVELGSKPALLVGRRMLVVLDNASAPSQIRPLLPASAGCATIVTSRADLRGLAVTEGAIRLELTPLDAEEAREVLGDMVGRARAMAEPDAARDLAVACGRLPLALRIAGANGRQPAHVAQRLHRGAP